MQTKRLIYKYKGHDAINEAAVLLKAGEVVAFPTETVYGLGADATNRDAVDKIFLAKGRPSDNPLIVHVANKNQLKSLVEEYPDYVDQLMEAFSPGPITYVLKNKGQVAKNVTGGLKTVGIRIPNHPVALELLRTSNLPLAAPSANISGKPSPTTAQHVADDLNGRIPAILDGGAANVGLESTVVDCTKDVPVILRLGQITKEAMEEIVGRVRISDAKKIDAPKSPGVKYKHYMPEVPLVFISKDEVISYIKKEKSKGKKIGVLTDQWENEDIKVDKLFLLGENEPQIAANLYDTLRAMKQADVDLVVVYGLTKEKTGEAVIDRLQRAATKGTP